MSDLPAVGIGIIGAGFIAETRARGYAAVRRYDARIVAVSSRRREGARAFASRHGLRETAVEADYRRLLERTDDGSRGIVWASDAVLGGMESTLQVLASNTDIKCRLSHTGQVEA